MQDFRKLDVWRRSHNFVLRVYRISGQLPKDERFGLTSQIRRAAGSIPANIAEGCGRKSRVELRQFLYISMGSASELEYHLLLARDLHMIDANDYREAEAELLEIRRMLPGLLQKLIQ
ncbi:MAG: four helix bundle protein [Candidatus Acidiferrum sp.]